MSEYVRPLLPCGHDSDVDVSADEFQTASCTECGERFTEFQMQQLLEENSKRIRQAECPHVLTTLVMQGAGIVRHTCDACGADRPLPEAKPPRRMLKPRKAVLYGELRDLKVELAEARATIEASDRELQAIREAYQRLWAKTQGRRSATAFRRALDRVARWWKSRGYAAGGLTGTGDPAMIASRNTNPEGHGHG